MPVVIALYGWNAQWHVPLPFALFTVGLLGSTLMLAFVPLLLYVADAFGIYAASATTGVIVTRCLMGTFLPLAVQPVLRKFGYGVGFTILGGMSLALAPLPILIMRCGFKWRQRSEYSRIS
jgi:hypothetical protein